MKLFTALIFLSLAFSAFAESVDVTFSWDMPTTYMDGSPLSPDDIQGYKVRITDSQGVRESETVSLSFDDSIEGRTTFEVATVNTAGLTGPYSSVVVPGLVSSPGNIRVTVTVEVIQ